MPVMATATGSVALVASQTGATEEAALAALIETHGDIAEAILKLAEQ